MELTEKIESINRQLEDSFGIDTITGRPIWRVVWSDDQYEDRFGTYDDFTPEGIYLRTVTEVRRVKKYPWVKERWTLERLVLVPVVSQKELPTVKQSYEPMFPFQKTNGEYAPPTILACRFIIDSVLAAQGKGSTTKYKDKYDGMSKEEYYEAKNAELQQLQDDLFGNETDVGDAIAHGEAVIVPRNYEKES